MEKSQKRNNDSNIDNIRRVDFHGASILNEHGDEIAITERMVRQACDIYIRMWETVRKHKNENKTCNSPANNSSCY